MKYFVTYLFLMTVSIFEMKAQVDPKFQIYLCFGQSNMSGDAPAEAIDMEVDKRFLTLEATNGTANRTKGQWYIATPPIIAQGNYTQVGIADYFGRTMVEALPDDYRIGVVNVAVNGADIRAFMSELAEIYNPWQTNYFARYDNDPYKRLVDMAKIAQQSGVIKGILLHQGEANCGDPEWTNYVKIIYERLLSDLGLNAVEVPLLVGEVVNATENGECAAHNEVIAQVPSVIPTAHVISSVGCPGILHFTRDGYRILGKRYALKMLEILGYQFQVNETGLQGPVLKANSYTREYGEPNPVFGYTIENGSINGTPQIVCDATSMSPVGTYPIKISRGSMAEDNADFFYGMLTITKAQLTITAKSYTRVEGYPNPSFEVMYSGFKNGETDDVLTQKPTVSTTATQNSEPGTYDINVSDAMSQNYTINHVKGTLTVAEKKLGDVNADTKVDEKDLKAVINHIMGMTPEGFFDVNMANINKDDKVDATDVVCLINLMRLNQ